MTGKQTAGAFLWVLSIQYYIVQFITAAVWTAVGFSWTRNTISDLANTQCGQYGVRLVCSPLHTWMNTSFVILGITMITGAYLLAQQLATNKLSYAGFGCLALAGAGTILVGIFPENTVSSLHITGAALSFIFGNFGMILLGSGLRHFPRSVRMVSIIFGVIGLVALLCFQLHTYLGLSLGGMERIVAYPQSIWMILFGSYILATKGHVGTKPSKV